MSDSEAPQISRMALFALAHNESLSEDDINFVAGGVRSSIKRKLEVSVEEFRGWIEDRHSGLIRSIECRSGNELTRPQIRAALLELAWRSVMAFTTTVDIQVRAFRSAMPGTFSTGEDYLFEESYCANPVFGGLPLLLLHDRLPLIKEAMINLWLASDKKRAAATVRTLLYYYSIIIANRRDADRLYKRRAQAIGVLKGAACEVELNDAVTNSKRIFEE